MSDNSSLQGGPLDRIHAQLNQLRGVNLKIARWLLQHDRTDVGLTTTRIAEAVNTSRASVVRFCLRLGYPGFAKFKEAWIEQVVATERRSSAEEPTAHLPASARRVYDLAYETVSTLPTLLDAAGFEATAQAMSEASLTVWCGLTGDSGFVAQSGDHKMTVAGLRSRAVTDVQGLRSLAQSVSPGDLLVVVSQSGAWSWIADEMRAYRRRGCRVALITNYATSIMAKAADYVLLAPARELTPHGKPTGLRASQWLLVDMLIAEAISRARASILGWP